MLSLRQQSTPQLLHLLIDPLPLLFHHLPLRLESLQSQHRIPLVLGIRFFNLLHHRINRHIVFSRHTWENRHISWKRALSRQSISAPINIYIRGYEARAMLRRRQGIFVSAWRRAICCVAGAVAGLESQNLGFGGALDVLDSVCSLEDAGAVVLHSELVFVQGCDGWEAFTLLPSVAGFTWTHV